MTIFLILQYTYCTIVRFYTMFYLSFYTVVYDIGSMGRFKGAEVVRTRAHAGDSQIHILTPERVLFT